MELIKKKKKKGGKCRGTAGEKGCAVDEYAG